MREPSGHWIPASQWTAHAQPEANQRRTNPPGGYEVHCKGDYRGARRTPRDLHNLEGTAHAAPPAGATGATGAH